MCLQHWLSPTLRGVLLDCDGTFVFLEMERRGGKYEVLVPVSSIQQMFREPFKG